MPSSSAAAASSFVLLCVTSSSVSAVDFLFNSFKPGDLTLIGDARVDAAAVRLTNDSNQFSLGRAFYPAKLAMVRNANTTTTTTGGEVSVSSFSTSFVFSVVPDIPSSPGFGLAFVLSASMSPPGAFASQYFGLFSYDTRRTTAPLLAVEFDTGRNTEAADPDENHVGIDLNYIESSATERAGYYQTSSSSGGTGEEFVAIDMRSGRNVRAWVDFDGPGRRINVTLAPAEVTQKPRRPLLSYSDPDIPSYLSPEMFVGFSASKTLWVEAQRVLAWSLRDDGLPAREINTTGLPDFSLAASPSSPSSPSAGLIAGVTCAAAALALGFVGLLSYHLCRRRGRRGVEEEVEEEEEEWEEWEVKYWPHRFPYAELRAATKGFSAEHLLGYGGFGKVYKGVLPRKEEGEEVVAVKCVSHDSKQGLKEFMAEISSMGRLRHKNLVHLRGWCRKGTELTLVYDYMPNGSLDRWLFPRPTYGSSSSSASAAAKALGWEGRRRVLEDVAEGLQYLHHGWDQVVLHRDIKCSNILLDESMRGRLGDFGLARLHQRGESLSSTRVVGTLGYLAPELARMAAPSAASDVYSFGVVVLEAACGRRPIEEAHGEEGEEEDVLLVEWVRELYAAGRVREAADRRVEGEYRAEDMELVLKLGLACCHPDPAQRPSMKEVVQLLHQADAAAAVSAQRGQERPDNVDDQHGLRG